MKKPETEKVLIIIEEFLAEIRRRLEGHPPRVRHKQDWGRGFILLLPQSAVLPGPDAGSHGAKQHRVLSSKTVRPLAPYSARCIGYVIKTWSAICSMAPRLQFGDF